MIEEEKRPSSDLNLMSQRENQLKKQEVYHYREKFLEYVVSLGEKADYYQTMLAEVYIDNLFLIQDRSLKEEIFLPDLINPRRKKFQ